MRDMFSLSHLFSLKDFTTRQNNCDRYQYSMINGNHLRNSKNNCYLSSYYPLNILCLSVIGNEHGVVKTQFCNHQDLAQRKTSLVKSPHEKTL